MGCYKALRIPLRIPFGLSFLGSFFLVFLFWGSFFNP